MSKHLNSILCHKVDILECPLMAHSKRLVSKTSFYTLFNEKYTFLHALFIFDIYFSPSSHCRHFFIFLQFLANNLRNGLTKTHQNQIPGTFWNLTNYSQCPNFKTDQKLDCFVQQEQHHTFSALAC